MAYIIRNHIAGITSHFLRKSETLENETVRQDAPKSASDRFSYTGSNRLSKKMWSFGPTGGKHDFYVYQKNGEFRVFWGTFYAPEFRAFPVEMLEGLESFDLWKAQGEQKVKKIKDAG